MSKDAGENFVVHLCSRMDLISFDGKRAKYLLDVDKRTHEILAIVGSDWADYEPDPPEPDDEGEDVVEV